MKTPDEKACELLENAFEQFNENTSKSKRIVALAINELILESKGYNSERESYWLSVKSELEKL